MIISGIIEMASSNSQNSSRDEWTEVPATPSSNVQVSTCSSGLRYKLYPVEDVFPLLIVLGSLTAIFPLR